VRIFFTGVFSAANGTPSEKPWPESWAAGARREHIPLLVLLDGLPVRIASLRTPKREVRMKRSLTLTLLLATMLAVAACGESETGQSGRSSPAEPQQTKAESDQQSVAEEAAREEATRKRVPANNEAAQNEQGSTRVDDESPGLSVTTLEGEQVNLGGQGDVTALYFMAGW
jgi:hypothetical protein